MRKDTLRVSKPSGKLGRIYGRMLKQCPEAIASYGACIGKNLSEISKDCCKKEYAQLQQCFASARAGK